MVSRYRNKQTIAKHSTENYFLSINTLTLEIGRGPLHMKMSYSKQEFTFIHFSEKSAVMQFFSPAHFKMLKNLKKIKIKRRNENEGPFMLKLEV